MGTNFYLTKQSNRCEHCGRADETEPLHIGKSSSGWAFGLHIHPSEGIECLDDWIRLFSDPTAVIKDEYGKLLTPAEMIDWIMNRSQEAKDKPHGYENWEQFHKENESRLGPHNLLFSTRKVDSEGDTWQCFDHDFS